jgi:hypothetical protein
VSFFSAFSSFYFSSGLAPTLLLSWNTVKFSSFKQFTKRRKRQTRDPSRKEVEYRVFVFK